MVARLVAALIGMVAVLGFASGSALADLWVSSGGSDAVNCVQANPCATISRAVSLASANDTIHVGAGTFTEHVTIPASINGRSISGLDLQGAGTHLTTVSGGFDGRGSVFTIGSGETVTISDLSISGGEAVNGGGINDVGLLTLERDEIAANSATGSAAGGGGEGGGIYSENGLTVLDSEILNNQASSRGGGVYAGAITTMTRDLILQNVLYGNSSGSALVGGGVFTAFASLSEDTVTGNLIRDASGNTAGIAGGVFAPQSKLMFDTVVGNSAALDSSAFGPDAEATILDGRCRELYDHGWNLVADPSCASSATSRVANPMLGTLADNGGPTETMAISTSSPAYDAVPSNLCSGTDQRGVSLLQRGAAACDVGAYQVSAPTTYVANPSANSVTAYGADANGNTAPVLDVSGSATGLNQPTGVVTDVNGKVYVANSAGNSITEYAPEVTGNVAPVATIAGAATNLSRPQDVALDSSGDLFVTNLNRSVTEYAPGASGNVAPLAQISGSATRLFQPSGIVIDPNGNLRVADSATIFTYGAAANGNVAPLSQLKSAALKGPRGLAFDAAGDLLVAASGGHTVETFTPGAAGSTGPLRALTVQGPALSAPTGLDLDVAGDVFVTDPANNGVIEYSPGSGGLATPLSSISGDQTGLSAPAFLSELPPTPAPGMRISVGRRQRRKQILDRGIALRVTAWGSLAFRGQPVLISAVARVGGATVATVKATRLRPGRTVLRLVTTRRAARALPGHHTRLITVTTTVRGDAGTQHHRVTVICTG